MAAKYKRVLAVLILLLLVAQMLYIGQKNQPEEEEEIVIEHPLLIWYTDPDIQAYMEASAAEAVAMVPWLTSMGRMDISKRVCSFSSRRVTESKYCSAT